MYTGLQLAAASIVMLQPEYNSEYDIYLPVTPELVQEALDKDPEIGAVYLTSPNMEGLIADYEGIRQIC